MAIIKKTTGSSKKIDKIIYLFQNATTPSAECVRLQDLHSMTVRCGTVCSVKQVREAVLQMGFELSNKRPRYVLGISIAAENEVQNEVAVSDFLKSHYKKGKDFVPVREVHTMYLRCSNPPEYLWQYKINEKLKSVGVKTFTKSIQGKNVWCFKGLTRRYSFDSLVKNYSDPNVLENVEKEDMSVHNKFASVRLWYARKGYRRDWGKLSEEEIDIYVEKFAHEQEEEKYTEARKFFEVQTRKRNGDWGDANKEEWCRKYLESKLENWWLTGDIGGLSPIDLHARDHRERVLWEDLPPDHKPWYLTEYKKCQKK